MPRYRFVDPDAVRLNLSDDDWIEVKKRLTYGEQQRLNGAAMAGKMSKDSPEEMELGMDWERFNLERLSLWLTDWSFQDQKGKPVKLSRSAISALDPDTVAEIDAALDRHIEELEAEKKARAGAPTSVTA